jgi:GNAT superfamily N-acetyltransferase
MMLTFRDAVHGDLPFIVRLITEDSVVDTDDDPTDSTAPEYRAALDAITSSESNRLVVAELEGDPVGTLQLTFIPGLNRRGMWRCLVEAVHIAPGYRSRGLGGEMMRWAIEQARVRGCGVVQLTSNKKRADAHRFYERLGFRSSHEGFKLYISEAESKPV